MVSEFTINRFDWESEYYSLHIDNNQIRMDFSDSSLFYVRRRDFRYSLSNQSQFHPYSLITPTPFDLEFTTFEGTNVVVTNNIVLITLNDDTTVSVESNSGIITLWSEENIYDSQNHNEFVDKTPPNTLLCKWRCSRGRGRAWVFKLLEDDSTLESNFSMSIKVITKYTVGGSLYDDFVVGENNTPLLSTSYLNPTQNTLEEIFDG